MTRIRTTTSIARPREEVFDFLTTPANWTRWHPSTIAVTGDAEHPQTLGEHCVEEFVVAGRRGITEWTVIGCDRPVRWTIEAHPPNGGHATITYELAAGGGTTTFTRTLEYTMPNPFLALLDLLVLRARVDRESTTALANVKRVLETSYQAAVV